MINHSCVANCRYHISRDTTTMSVQAKRPILKGEEITIHYVGISLENIVRKRSLQKHWKFDCPCERCLDPTEFGSHLQAIKCKLCFEMEEKGFLLPVCSNNNDAVGVKVRK